jgi:hypothetical protein
VTIWRLERLPFMIKKASTTHARERRPTPTYSKYRFDVGVANMYKKVNTAHAQERRPTPTNSKSDDLVSDWRAFIIKVSTAKTRERRPTLDGSQPTSPGLDQVCQNPYHLQGKYEYICRRIRHLLHFGFIRCRVHDVLHCWVHHASNV